LAENSVELKVFSTDATNQTKIYSAMIKLLQNEMGAEPLAEVLRDVRESGIIDMLPFTHDEPAMQMFSRLGWLSKLHSAREKLQRAEQIINDFSTVLDRTPAIVSVVFRLFADGLYGVLPKGICSVNPQCFKCTLTKVCSYYNAPRSTSGREKHLSANVRLEKNDFESLSDEEILALIIGSGSATDLSLENASQLLNRFGSLRNIAAAGFTELTKLSSVNKGVARRISAACNLSFRISAEKRKTSPSIHSGEDFYNLYKYRLRDIKQEVFWVVLLDQKNCVISDIQIAQGSLSKVLVHPREVFLPAIKGSAAAIAVLHNHPSGDSTPSREDKAITERLKSAAEIIGIQLLDHVIIGEESYTSFVDEGIL
jgi:DNA repair protein RadC